MTLSPFVSRLVILCAIFAFGAIAAASPIIISEPGQPQIHAVVFSPDEKFIAYTGNTCVVKVVELATQETRLSIDLRPQGEPYCVANQLAFSRDGAHLATAIEGTAARKVHVFNLRTKSQEIEWAYSNTNAFVRFIDNSNILVATDGLEVRFLDLDSGTQSGFLTGFKHAFPEFSDVTASMIGISGGTGGEFGVFDLVTQKKAFYLKREDFWAGSVAFGSSGSRLAVSSPALATHGPDCPNGCRTDTTLSMYDLVTQTLLWSVQDPGTNFVQIAMSKGSKYLGVTTIASDNKWDSARLYSAVSGKLLRSIPKQVKKLKFSPVDDRILLYSDVKFTVPNKGSEAVLMDIATGQIIKKIQYDQTILETQFSPTGKYVVIGGQKGKIMVDEVH